ncbi:MAG: DNA cytosine methyltransferase [Dehalococcoidia bacterium]|nr:DNA cytosine methyltransferase [Dehalococcoidia bacterium]
MILSIFPGIDLFGRAFEEEGYCVVRGPDLIYGGTIKTFHPPRGIFSGIIGGPPCQAFSKLRHLVIAHGYDVAPNMIPEFERVVHEAQPGWFCMENVEEAPEPVVDGYQVSSHVYNNRWTGADQNRVRRFSFGTPDGRPLILEEELWHSQNWEPAVLAHGGDRLVSRGVGPKSKGKRSLLREMGYQSMAYFRHAVRLQGLPEGFDLPGMTVVGKIKCVGNGVPLPMGREIARAIKRAMEVRST